MEISILAFVATLLGVIASLCKSKISLDFLWKTMSSQVPCRWIAVHNRSMPSTIKVRETTSLRIDAITTFIEKNVYMDKWVRLSTAMEYKHDGAKTYGLCQNPLRLACRTTTVGSEGYGRRSGTVLLELLFTIEVCPSYERRRPYKLTW